MELERLSDLYLERREERLPRVEKFWSGERGWLVVQRPSYHLWGECNSVEGVWNNNLRHLESWLAMPWSDELPHMQAWFGTGVYANAFGCEYLWRQGEAPDSHVRYHSIEEVRGIAMPDWRGSPVMGMVLECIDLLKERSRGRFPIALTDTQSPFDTATLVLDTSEFFTACYTEEETVAGLMAAVTDLIIAFSREQARHIGDDMVSRPGHVMPSLPGLPRHHPLGRQPRRLLSAGEREILAALRRDHRRTDGRRCRALLRGMGPHHAAPARPGDDGGGLLGFTALGPHADDSRDGARRAGREPASS